MWFFSFYSLVTSCFACHLNISCKSCTCLSLCKLGHLLSSCLGHWFCMLFKLGSCISKRARLVGEKESILIRISSLPDAQLHDTGYNCVWSCCKSGIMKLSACPSGSLNKTTSKFRVRMVLNNLWLHLSLEKPQSN